MTEQTAVICPTCQQRYKIAAAMLGREVSCPKCMARFEAVAADPPSPPAGHRPKKPFPLYELFLEEPSEQWFAMLAFIGPMTFIIAAVLTSEQAPELRLTAWGVVGYSSLWLLLALLPPGTGGPGASARLRTPSSAAT